MNPRHNALASGGAIAWSADDGHLEDAFDRLKAPGFAAHFADVAGIPGHRPPPCRHPERLCGREFNEAQCRPGKRLAKIAET